MPGLVLGLDLATRTGWAHDDPAHQGRPVSGTLLLPFSEGGEFGPAFTAFRQWLVRRIIATRPIMVTFESPMQVVGAGASSRRTSQGTIRKLIGLTAIAEQVAHETGVPCSEVNIGTVKKHFTGDGRADKKAMIHGCQIRGWPCDSDNAADACAVWSLAKCTIDPKFQPAVGALFAR